MAIAGGAVPVVGGPYQRKCWPVAVDLGDFNTVTLLHPVTYGCTWVHTATNCYTLLHTATHCYTMLHNIIRCLVDMAFAQEGRAVIRRVDDESVLGRVQLVERLARRCYMQLVEQRLHVNGGGSSSAVRAVAGKDFVGNDSRTERMRRGLPHPARVSGFAGGTSRPGAHCGAAVRIAERRDVPAAPWRRRYRASASQR